MNLLELQQERGRLINEEKSVLGGIQDKTKIDADVTEKLDNLGTAIRSVETLMRATERQEEEQRSKADSQRQQEIQERASTDEKGIKDMTQKVFQGFLRGVKLNDLNPTEVALFKEAQKRGQVVGTDSAGGYLTPDYFSAEVIKTMKWYGGMEQVAKVITTNDGNDISYPKRDSTSIKGALIAEATAADASSITYGRLTLNAWKYTTGEFTVSNELIQDSIVNAEREIIEVAGESFGRILNEHFTTGSGSSRPTGLIYGLNALASSAGIGVTGSSTTAVTYANLVDLVHSVDPAYRMGSGATWMFNDLTLGAIRKLVDSTGQPIWQMGNIQNGSPDTILGYKYTINQDMASLGAAAAPIVFGDLAKAYIIRRVNGVGLRRLNELHAVSDEVGFVGFLRADGDLADTKAAKLFKNAAS